MYYYTSGDCFIELVDVSVFSNGLAMSSVTVTTMNCDGQTAEYEVYTLCLVYNPVVHKNWLYRALNFLFRIII